MLKKLLFIIFFSLLSSSLFAQQFSFPLYFEDALGNKDTLVFGYDNTATDSIDANFGEIDIKNSPYDSSFEARITACYPDMLHCFVNSFDPSAYHLKKQIHQNKCALLHQFVVYSIYLKGSHFPITVSWNDALFSDSCNIKSLITDWTPGGWFDAGCGNFPNQGPYFLNFTSSVTFDRTHEQFISPFNSNDTINVLYFTLASYSFLSGLNDFLTQSRSEAISVVPNPSTNYIQISKRTEENTFSNFRIYKNNQLRYATKSLTSSNRIDVSLFESGLYYFECFDSNGHHQRGKFIVIK